jgi:hypothetical protein
MFRPIEGRENAVRDEETGIEITLRSGPDYQYPVIVQLLDGRQLLLSIAVERSPFAGPDPSDPTIRILTSTLQCAAAFWGKTREDNTKFVRLILEGLSTINRVWPLSRSPYFYSDSQKFAGRESTLSFNLPSEEEIAQL